MNRVLSTRTDIKPCPFCGSVKFTGPNPGEEKTYVECFECEAMGPYGETAEDAIRIWNTRK